MPPEGAGNRVTGGKKKKKMGNKAPHRGFLSCSCHTNHPASVLQRWLNAFCVPLKTLSTGSIVFLLFQCLAQMQNSMFCGASRSQRSCSSTIWVSSSTPSCSRLWLYLPIPPYLAEIGSFWEQALFVLQEVKATVLSGCLHDLLL